MSAQPFCSYPYLASSRARSRSRYENSQELAQFSPSRINRSLLSTSHTDTLTLFPKDVQVKFMSGKDLGQHRVFMPPP